MLVAVAGMSHRSAPVEVRERVAFPPCAGRGFCQASQGRGRGRRSRAALDLQQDRGLRRCGGRGRQGAGARVARRRQGRRAGFAGAGHVLAHRRRGRAASVQGRGFAGFHGRGRGSDPRPGPRGLQGGDRGALRGTDPQPPLPHIAQGREEGPLRDGDRGQLPLRAARRRQARRRGLRFAGRNGGPSSSAPGT